MPEKTKPSAPAVSRTAPQSKDKEPRRKATTDAVLGWYPVPVSQQQPVDPRSLLPSLQTAGKQDKDEKEKVTATGTAIEATGSPDSAPTQPSASVAFGLRISGVPSPAGQQNTDTSSSPKEARPQTRTETPDTATATPGVDKAQLQTASNGSRGQHSQDSSKDSELAKSSPTAADAHERTPPDSVSHTATGAKADVAAPASGISAQVHQTLPQPGPDRNLCLRRRCRLRPSRPLASPPLCRE
jgi:hypothetical protein